MQNKVIYEFAIIRLVPKVEREEFLNIGVIVFSKRKKYLGIKYKLDERRIKAFSSEVDTEMINKYLEGWELICKGGSNAGSIGKFELSYRFRWLVASKSSIIQTSKPHPGLCEAPEKVLEDIFKSHVL